MFDDKKIIFNRARALNQNNEKVNLFLHKLSIDALQRLEIKFKSNFSVLEILAKNTAF